MYPSYNECREWMDGWMNMVKGKITVYDSRYRPRHRVEPSEAAGSKLILQTRSSDSADGNLQEWCHSQQFPSTDKG